MALYSVVHGHAGKVRSPEYRAWIAIMQKCTNSKNPKFAGFGGVGIKICDRWREPGGFTNFLADLGPKPSRQHCIERKDLTGDFTPGNCFWAAPGEQTRNGQLHGHCRGKKPPEYSAWMNMKMRCFNPKSDRFENYGGRGITVCQEWLGRGGFSRFLSDMGTRPSNKHSIDRKDVNGNYCKDNCRWATAEEQMSNTTRTISITFNGETKTLSQWSRHTGLSVPTLIGRLERGWPLEQALSSTRLTKWSRRRTQN